MIRAFVVKRSTPRGSSGFGIFDGLLYLVYLGVAVAGLYGAFQLLFGGTTVRNADADLVAIQGAVRELYGGRSSYSTLADTTSLANGRLVPEAIINMDASNQPDGTLRNRFGGVITIAVDSSNARQFTITYDNVPRNACSRLVTKADPSLWVAVQVNSGTVFDAPTGTLPPDPTTVGAECSSDTANEIIWTSK